MKKKIIILVILFLLGLLFSDISLAAKKSKWQSMLERNSVPIIYWQKYLPKVSRGEYRKAVKNYQDKEDNEEVNIIEGKYPLPDPEGKIAREQHLWLKDNQSSSSHYKMTDTSKSCQNGMAGGYGAFGALNRGDKGEEKYYVNMRWGYADWVEPESDLKEKLEKKDKSLLLKSAEGFPKSGYIKIESEYIRYSSKSGDKLKGLSRGYKSSASDHAKGDNAKLEYKYKGGNWERVTKVINVEKKKKDWYKRKKVLVTNNRNGEKVVASILESGPAIWTGRVGGLSPEAYEAIGAKTNENCTFQYVDEKTNLGSVN